jgi:hypothetical protein
MTTSVKLRKGVQTLVGTYDANLKLLEKSGDGRAQLLRVLEFVVAIVGHVERLHRHGRLRGAVPALRANVIGIG